MSETLTEERSASGVDLDMGSITIDFVDWGHPDAEGLRSAQQWEIAVRYGGPDATPHEQPPFLEVDSIVATIVLRDGADAVAVGSLRDLAGVSDGIGGVHPAGTGEVKRVYVDPAYRRRGLSRWIMQELESRATAAGLDRIVLESGTMQPEAIGLYLSLGYDPVETYGMYADSPDSRCFAKWLVADSGSTPPDGTLTGAVAPDSTPAVRIRQVPWDDPVALALRRENFELSTSVLYPEVLHFGFERLDASAGVHAVAAFVAEDETGPVGCLALTRFVTGDGPRSDTGELRKLYVRSAARGGGVARALVAAVEELARHQGMRRLVLESGIRQRAAVRLYTSLGYVPTRPYPPFEDNAVALCFAKSLPQASH